MADQQSDTVQVVLDATFPAMEQLNKMLTARGVTYVQLASMPEFPGDKSVPIEKRKLRWRANVSTSQGEILSYTDDPVLAMQSQDGHNLAIVLSLVEIARMLGFSIDLVSGPPT